jgi:hypothetical protein
MCGCLGRREEGVRLWVHKSVGGFVSNLKLLFGASRFVCVCVCVSKCECVYVCVCVSKCACMCVFCKCRWVVGICDFCEWDFLRQMRTWGSCACRIKRSLLFDMNAKIFYSFHQKHYLGVTPIKTLI